MNSGASGASGWPQQGAGQNQIWTQNSPQGGGYANLGRPQAGMASMGGMTPMGGAAPMGGMTPMNGAALMNGMAPMNGAAPIGGMAPMNGAAPMGGMAPMGGAAPMGGMAPMGGVSPMGGAAPMGGMTPLGGVAPMGGMAQVGSVPQQGAWPNPGAQQPRQESRGWQRQNAGQPFPDQIYQGRDERRVSRADTPRIILTILTCAVVPLLFVTAILFRTIPLVTIGASAAAVAMLVVLWLSGIFERPTNLMISVLYAVAIAVMVILVLTAGGGNPDASANPSSQTGSVTASPPPDEAPGVFQETSGTQATPSPSADLSAADESINAASYFLSYWRMKQYDQMVNLCTRTWSQSLGSGKDPKNELYGLLRGRGMLDFTYQAASGTINDQRREITYQVQITLPNNSESTQILKISVERDPETGRWMIDPRSIVTNRPADTPTPAVTLPTQPPTPAPIADPNTLLYYNPDGGTRYHLNRNCPSAAAKFLPFKGVFTYGELNSSQYRNLTPCAECSAPLRPSN